MFVPSTTQPAEAAYPPPHAARHQQAPSRRHAAVAESCPSSSILAMLISEPARDQPRAAPRATPRPASMPDAVLNAPDSRMALITPRFSRCRRVTTGVRNRVHRALRCPLRYAPKSTGAADIRAPDIETTPGAPAKSRRSHAAATPTPIAAQRHAMAASPHTREKRDVFPRDALFWCCRARAPYARHMRRLRPRAAAPRSPRDRQRATPAHTRCPFPATQSTAPCFALFQACTRLVTSPLMT